MPPRSHTSTDPAVCLAPILRLLSQTPPDAYSAHQKTRTTAARLIAVKAYDAAVQVLFGAARELIKIGEHGSGCDLGLYLVQVYQQADVKVNAESRARVTQLLALLTPNDAWRKKLSDTAIKWSADHGDCPIGDPDLHHYIGQLQCKDGQFMLAEPHLVAACKRDSAIVLADMMYDWSKKGKEDPGPLACRAVIPWISIKPPAILPARAFLQRFIQLLAGSDPNFVSSTLSPPGSEGDEESFSVTTSQAVNFLQLAVATVQQSPPEGTTPAQARGTSQVGGTISRDWEGLVRRYRPALSSQAMQEALLHISTNTFLIPPPRGAGGADMLQSLMGSLFGGAPGR